MKRLVKRDVDMFDYEEEVVNGLGYGKVRKEDYKVDRLGMDEWDSGG